MMKMIEYLIWLKIFKAIPMSTERPCQRPSKGELKRWCRKGAVVVNGGRPNDQDMIQFPVTSLVFFPRGKRRTTVL